MSEISLFFELGIHHILNRGAIDHLLFLSALTVVFDLKDYKKLLVLITIFTVSHTLSLVLLSYKIISVRTDVVEEAIVWTIIITALTNILIRKTDKLKKIHIAYVFFFGLIHGAGFTHTFLMSISGAGGILIPLLSFAGGIEIGQVLFIVVFLVISRLVFVKLLHVPEQNLILGVSFFILGYALSLI